MALVIRFLRRLLILVGLTRIDVVKSTGMLT